MGKITIWLCFLGFLSVVVVGMGDSVHYTYFFAGVDFAPLNGTLKPESNNRPSALVCAVVLKTTSKPVILGYMSNEPSISGNKARALAGNPIPILPLPSPEVIGRPCHSFNRGKTISTNLSKNWYISFPRRVTLTPIGIPSLKEKCVI